MRESKLHYLVNYPSNVRAGPVALIVVYSKKKVKSETPLQLLMLGFSKEQNSTEQQ